MLKATVIRFVAPRVVTNGPTVSRGEPGCRVGCRTVESSSSSPSTPNSTPTRWSNSVTTSPDPWSGRHPRARQRTGTNRVGRVRHRDARSRGRRCDHHRRHATQQHPADRRRRGIGGQAAGGGRTGVCRRRVLGWGGAGQCSGSAWAPRRGSVRLQVLPAALRSGRVSTARSGGTRTGVEGNCIVRCDDDRARRRRARN